MNCILVKINRKNGVSAIAQFNDTHLVGHIQCRLVIINGKHDNVFTSTLLLKA